MHHDREADPPMGHAGQRSSPGAATAPGAISVLDPVAPLTPAELAAVRPRPPADPAPVGIPSTAVGIVVGSAADREAPSGSGTPPGGPQAGSTGQPGTAADPCESLRVLAQERCEVATSARDQARAAADALRDAQRAYDTLVERVETAQAQADPRALAAAKENLHRAFRAASAAAMDSDAAEAAAREWLDEINRLNSQAKDAARRVETGNAEMRAALPRLERLSLEADAARISAEGAEQACRDAREAVARCEEPPAEAAVAETAATVGRPPAPWPGIGGWPTDAGPGGGAGEPGDAEDAGRRQSVIVRILDGDRETRDRLIATLAAGDGEATRAWQMRTRPAG